MELGLILETLCCVRVQMCSREMFVSTCPEPGDAICYPAKNCQNLAMKYGLEQDGMTYISVHVNVRRFLLGSVASKPACMMRSFLAAAA